MTSKSPALSLMALLVVASCSPFEAPPPNRNAPASKVDAGLPAGSGDDFGTTPESPSDGSPELEDAGVPQGVEPSDAGVVDGSSDGGGTTEPSDAGAVQPPADAGVPPPPPPPARPTMSFFVSSRGGGKGGDFRRSPSDPDGLAGADELCSQLASLVSPELKLKTWRAYLSTTQVNARSRIGTGPWRNAQGVVIAESLEQLHEENGLKNRLDATTALDEKGNVLVANDHDILTGTRTNGTVSAGLHCDNWTDSGAEGGKVLGKVGHSNRTGGGFTSWNSAHETEGCAQSGNDSVGARGGRGSIYCFALE